MQQLSILAALFVYATASISSAQEVKDAPPDAKRTLEQMLLTADSFEIKVDGKPIEKIKTPVYRYNDPARHQGGAIWAFGTSGRPAALLTIAQDDSDKFVTETVVLSDAPFQAAIQERGPLYRAGKNPKFSGERMKILGKAKQPTGSKQLLRSQAKLLARKFKAFEIWNNDNETEPRRYQLRLLPKPIYEYTDSENGILAGSIFILSYGSNPELAIILEAHKNEWKCGFGRLGHAKTTAEFDGEQIYAHEWYDGSDPFYLFTTIAKPNAD